MKKNLRKLRWREEDVISYIEGKLATDTNSDDELDLYLSYTYEGKLDKNNYLNTYKSVIREMKKLYERK